MIHLIWRNLWRNHRRTLLTLGSMAIPFFLLMLLQTAVDSMERWRTWSDGNLRFAVYHKTGLAVELPGHYVDKLARLPGAVAVTPYVGFGGTWRGHRKPVGAVAIDTATWRRIWPEGVVTDADWRAFFQDRTGALVEARNAERFGWKIGDRVTIESPKAEISVTIRALIHDFPDPNAFFIHRAYGEEVMGRTGRVNLIWVSAPNPEAMPALQRAAEEMFANSPAEVKTELEKGFVDRIIYQQGNLKGVIGGLGTMVVAVVILMAANSIAIGVRERTTEIAMMKALGFTRWLILAMILVESALLGFGGGVLGCWGGYLTWSYPPAMKYLDPLGSARYVNLSWAAWAAFKWTWLAPLAGVIAGFIPAWNACRLPVAQTLRRTN